jgi:hypothetical protein
MLFVGLFVAAADRPPPVNSPANPRLQGDRLESVDVLVQLVRVGVSSIDADFGTLIW